MSINYSGCLFSEPISLTIWQAPSVSGIYAILVPDSQARPKPFRVVYFGEAGNLSTRGIGRSHHKYNDWLQQGGTLLSNLYIAIYPTLNFTEQQRLALEAQLIRDYRPACND